MVDEGLVDMVVFVFEVDLFVVLNLLNGIFGFVFDGVEYVGY